MKENSLEVHPNKWYSSMRLHLTVANVLSASTNNRRINMQQAQRAVDDVLATAMYVTRCTVLRSLGVTPGALAFHQD
eukprot:2640191-Ditylum_brightwellii.AAC.1